MSHYSCVITKNSNDLGHTQVMQQQTRRVSLPHWETVQTLLQDMLDKGIIYQKPLGISNHVSHKKDGSTWFCVDHRKVNAVTHKHAYTIPRVDDTLDTLSGSTGFSTIDLKSGYWQIEMAPADREKTAFCTQKVYLNLMQCHLVFVMPQPLSNVSWIVFWLGYSGRVV